MKFLRTNYGYTYLVKIMDQVSLLLQVPTIWTSKMKFLHDQPIAICHYKF